MNRRSLLVLTLGLSCLLTCAAHAQTTYTCVDLGGYGNATSINSAGQIAGGIGKGSPLTPDATRAFVITPLDTDGDGKPDTWYRDANNDGVNDLIAVLPAPAGATFVNGTAINNNGAVAGFTNLQPLFIGANGPAELLPASSRTNVYSINDSNVVCGSDYPKKGNYLNATIWSKTVTKTGTKWTSTMLGTPAGCLQTYAWAINNAGAVTARADTKPAIWLPSALYGRPMGWSVLPDLAGHGGDPLAINQLGQMVGRSGNNVASQAVLWLLTPAYGLPTGVTNLHTALPPFIESVANGLNNSPGNLLSVVGYVDDGISVQHAFVWQSNTQQMVDLNNVSRGIPANCTLTNAVAINDSGMILCQSNVNHNFLLIPGP